MTHIRSIKSIVYERRRNAVPVQTVRAIHIKYIIQLSCKSHNLITQKLLAKIIVHMLGSPFSSSYSVNRFSRYLLLKAHNDQLKIWTATHTFSLLILTQLTMAVNGLLLRQCVSKAIFKLTAYTSEFKFLLRQTIKYYILIFWVIKL